MDSENIFFKWKNKRNTLFIKFIDAMNLYKYEYLLTPRESKGKLYMGR